MSKNMKVALPAHTAASGCLAQEDTDQLAGAAFSQVHPFPRCILLNAGNQQFQGFLSWRLHVPLALEKHSLDLNIFATAATHKYIANAPYRRKREEACCWGN